MRSGFVYTPLTWANVRALVEQLRPGCRPPQGGALQPNIKVGHYMDWDDHGEASGWNNRPLRFPPAEADYDLAGFELRGSLQSEGGHAGA